MKEVLEYLKKCKTYFLATVEDDQPHVRPFGVAEEFEGKIYIQTGKVKNVSKQLKNNPKIEICATDGPTWLRIEAQVVEDDRREVKAYVLDKNPGLKSMYDPDDSNTQVFYLINATATFYSFTSSPRVVNF